jgi:adenylate cyclase
VDADAEQLRIGKNRIPVNDDMAALIPYRGAQGSFRYVSATDVMSNAVDKASLKNKIVLLGTTAAGLMDLRATPMQNVYPGVEVHANMVAGIMDGNIKQNPAYTQGIEFILLLLVGSLLAFSLPNLNPSSATMLTALCLGLLLGLNWLAWQAGNLALPLAALLVTISTLYFFNMAYGFFFESRLKRQLGRLFGLYIPPELVDEMAQNPNSYSLASQSRHMTVLFTDVRDFTSIAEGMAPEQLSLLMNRFLTPMTQAIHQHRGTIDKYMGDAIMAFWGAPVADNHHATHAVQAALAMTASLARLQDEFAAQGWPAIRIGIGLNSGDMVVGNMGSTFRMAYTVLGDAVNLGSRLEALTKYYAVSIIVSEDTKVLAPDFVYRELDRVRVKGRKKPLAIYEVLGEKEEVNEAALTDLQQYLVALDAYRNQDWPLAEALFKSLSQAQPLCRLYAIYMERIVHFQSNLADADWDGVANFREK